MKLKFLFAVVFCLTSFHFAKAGQLVNVQNKTAALTPADSAWNILEKISEDFKNQLAELKFDGEGSVLTENYYNMFSCKEIYVRKYRETGLMFWKNYPNDIRKYIWLLRTVFYAPRYWANIKTGAHVLSSYGSGTSIPIAINEDAVSAWNKVYPKLRNDYMQSKKVSLENKKKFHLAELSGYLEQRLNPAYNNSQKLDLNLVKKYLLSLDQDYFEYNTKDVVNGNFYVEFISINPLAQLNMLMTYSQENYLLNQNDLGIFLAALKNDAKSPWLQEWIDQKLTFLALVNYPIELLHTDIDNVLINLKEMRGKVVLIDIWSTSCKSCIARMPEIKRVYDNFMDQGFEVISVCLNSETDLEAVKKIEKKIGATWPILLVGGKKRGDTTSLGTKIMKRYGFFGVPQLILLDKQGKMILWNGKLLNGDFEPLIKNLLNKK